MKWSTKFFLMIGLSGFSLAVYNTLNNKQNKNLKIV
jgi:hypothetical protein